jgi:hypothetical protein
MGSQISRLLSVDKAPNPSSHSEPMRAPFVPPGIGSTASDFQSHSNSAPKSFFSTCESYISSFLSWLKEAFKGLFGKDKTPPQETTQPEVRANTRPEESSTPQDNEVRQSDASSHNPPLEPASVPTPKVELDSKEDESNLTQTTTPSTAGSLIEQSNEQNSVRNKDIQEGVKSEEKKTPWAMRNSQPQTMTISFDKASHYKGIKETQTPPPNSRKKQGVDQQRSIIVGEKENISPQLNVIKSREVKSPGQICADRHANIIEMVEDFLSKVLWKSMQLDLNSCAGLIVVEFYDQMQFCHALYAQDNNSFVDQMMTLIGAKKWTQFFQNEFNKKINDLDEGSLPDWKEIKLNTFLQIYSKNPEGKSELREYKLLWDDTVDEEALVNHDVSRCVTKPEVELNQITVKTRQDIAFFFPDDLKEGTESQQTPILEIINQALQL